MDNFWTTFFYIVVMLVIIVGAYFATKVISGKAGRLKSRQIRMVDRMSMGRDKHIVLVEVGGKNLLIGVTNQSINVLGDIDGAALKDKGEAPAPTQNRKGFGSQLRDFLVNMKDAPNNLNKARMEARQNQNSKPASEDDDYLTRMNEAIERRKNQADHRGKEEE